MGYNLKDGCSFLDNMETRTSGYASISVLTCNFYKKSATIVMTTFPSKDLAVAGAAPLTTTQKICKNWVDNSDPENPVEYNDFDTYIAVSCVDEGCNIKNNLYSFFENSPVVSEGAWKKKDWESDE